MMKIVAFVLEALWGHIVNVRLVKRDFFNSNKLKVVLKFKKRIIRVLLSPYCLAAVIS